MRGDHAFQLRVIAEEMARDMRGRVEPLREAIRRSEELKTAAQEELSLAATATGRLDTYDADALLCPKCWINQAVASQLSYISLVSTGDKFQCETCASQFIL
jgi:hypothetical protein